MFSIVSYPLALTAVASLLTLASAASAQAPGGPGNYSGVYQGGQVGGARGGDREVYQGGYIGGYHRGYSGVYEGGYPTTGPRGGVPGVAAPTLEAEAFPRLRDAALIAFVQVLVPTGAELWFDDWRSSQQGEVRHFTSPRLAPSAKYAYRVHARWMENGRRVDETRKMVVQAGDRLIVDLRQPEKQRK